MIKSKLTKLIMQWVFILSCVCIVVVSGMFMCKVIQYKAYIWLPAYIKDLFTWDKIVARSKPVEHLFFVFVDHHEHGSGEKGVKSAEDWAARYKKNVEGLVDSYGNRFQYTWFYAYDHKNAGSLKILKELQDEGYGEIEFHWHHGNDTNESFKNKLNEALDWFHTNGVLLDLNGNPRPFGFIHGNWALDNSEKLKHCGVNRELDILKEAGCYADFTFSTLGTPAQPKKINSIYYARDTDGPKSYNEGIDAEVGKVNKELMIFQGPLCFDFHDMQFESGAIENTSLFYPHRIQLWINHAPYVKGKSEWRFLKLYTHGVQSKDVILGENFRQMIMGLKEYCGNRNIMLHFVTARDAYNIIQNMEQTSL